MSKIKKLLSGVASNPVAERALHTFWQSALAVLAADTSGLTHVAVWKAAVVAGGAAALSAAKSALVSS